MEYARRCAVCGKIYCYTDQDLKNNKENAAAGAVSAIGAIASIFGGTAYHTFEFNKMSDRSLDKVIDYNKCPNCGSSNTVLLTAEELEKYRDNESSSTTVNPQPITINTNASPEALVERGMLFLEDQEWDKANAYFENALDADPKNVQAYVGKLLFDLHLSSVESLETYEKDFTDNSNYKKALRFSTEQEKEQLELIRKERIYNKAKKAGESKSISQLTEAAGLLEELGDYRDANKIVGEYYSQIEELEVKEEKEKQEKARKKQEQEYEAAISLYKKASNLQDYENASTALQKMNGYKESNKYAAECQKKIDQLNEEKRQEERQTAIRKKVAERAAKKRKTVIAITSAAVLVCILAILLVTQVIIPANNRFAAYREYGSILQSASVGDIIMFGSYEQDNDASNGAEDIGWIVLAKEDGRILVVSKYAFDYQEYNSSFANVTWESCSLRNWMNDTFLNTAFTVAERSIINKGTVTADKNPSYPTRAGNDTQDQVFLLSVLEVEKYFSSDDSRMCGLYSTNGEDACSWWLRSPGNIIHNAAFVNNDGSVYAKGGSVAGRNAVRPALWINLKS